MADGEHFADPDIRRTWIVDKGLTVFAMWSPTLPATEVDLFVEEPLPFDEACSRRIEVDLGDATLTIARSTTS